MSDTNAVVDAEASPAPALPKQERKPHTRSQPKRQPPYAVVLHNDPINGMDHVVRVLNQVFGYGSGRATWMMLQAHVGGRSIVWTGTLEVAELKVEQIHACGPDPRRAGAQPLKATAEPLPGD
jgi:ATP-dependent Clp protease adaptor protein ClpS